MGHYRLYGKTLALYQYCADYHSGQSSKGYALLCSLQIRLIRANIDTRKFDVRKRMHKPTYKRLENPVSGCVFNRSKPVDRNPFARYLPDAIPSHRAETPSNPFLTPANAMLRFSAQHAQNAFTMLHLLSTTVKSRQVI